MYKIYGKIISVEDDGVININFEQGKCLQISCYGDCCSHSYFTPEGGQDVEKVKHLQAFFSRKKHTSCSNSALDLQDLVGKYLYSFDALELDKSSEKYATSHSDYDNDVYIQVERYVFRYKDESDDSLKFKEKVIWMINSSNGYYSGHVETKLV